MKAEIYEALRDLNHHFDQAAAALDRLQQLALLDAGFVETRKMAALGFLGLGIQPTQASEWGYDLSRALDDAQAGNWHPAFWPGLMIVMLITGLTLVGEGLNESLNPALRRRRRGLARELRREAVTAAGGVGDGSSCLHRPDA